MLCTIVVVFTLTGLCRGNSDNSVPLLPPPPTVSRRMAQVQVASLRRQLMRDNYDYQHSDDDRRQQNVTERNVDDAVKFYNPQGGADHLQRASELDQANVNSFSAELHQQDQYEEQDRQDQQFGKHDQPVKYEKRRRRGPGHPHEQLGNNENRGQSEQPTENEQPDQYDQQGPRKQQHQLQQRGQNEQLGKFWLKHRSPNKQPGEPELGDQFEQSGQLERRGQLEHRKQDVERGPHEQRGQNARRPHKELGIYLECNQNDQREFGEPQEQLGQFDEQEPSMERKDRAAPPLTDAPSDELTVRDVRDREYTLARHTAHPDWPVEYYNKRRDTYDPEPMHRRPFGDLRSNYEKPIPRSDAANDQRVQKEQSTDNEAKSPEQELSPDEREALDRQAFDWQALDRLEMSGSENEGSDISESQKQPDSRYDYEYQPQSRQYSRVMRSTRTNRLQYTSPATRKAPPPQYDRMRNAPPYHRITPLGRHHSAPRDHNIAKIKDLLYYMDDNQLRRRSNHMSPDVPDEDQPTGDEPLSPQPTAGSLHSTTGIYRNHTGGQHTTVSARPSPVGIRPSPVSSLAGIIGPRVNPAGSQASHTGSRLSPVGSRASPFSTHSKPPHHAGTTGPPDLPRTQRERSFVVTVSPNNVTYKLFTLKSREGRRRVNRRLLEERGPESVAIISLDRAPLPAFRLPRARRQYMHEHHRHKPA